MNPVNAYLGPLFEQAFAQAIRRNFLAVVYGGAEEGSYLAHHIGIDEIHLTGSDRTYDSIVWGAPGPERDARKARNSPLLSKPVTAELGNITPVLVVPGPYTEKELAFQAESVAGGVAYNASFNCNSPKMLVTPMGWNSRQRLLTAIERSLGATPVRRAYYSGRRGTLAAAHQRTIAPAKDRRGSAGGASVDAGSRARRHGSARAGVRYPSRSARFCRKRKSEATIR